MVVLQCHVSRTERKCRSTRKAGEHRGTAPGFRAERSGGGASLGSPICSFRTSGAPLRRGGPGHRVAGGPKIEDGVHGKAPSRSGRTAQAQKQDQSAYAQFSRCAGSRGILGQNGWRDAWWRIGASKSTMSSTGWASITSPRHTGYSSPSGGSA